MNWIFGYEGADFVDGIPSRIYVLYTMSKLCPKLECELFRHNCRSIDLPLEKCKLSAGK